MKTPAGKECPHFYGDYYRGRNVEECRLLKAAGQPWTPDLCASCPVPEISLANACTYMQLNPTVGRSLSSAFMKRVQLKAYCDKSKKSVKEPHVGCGECHALPFDFKVRS